MTSRVWDPVDPTTDPAYWNAAGLNSETPGDAATIRAKLLSVEQLGQLPPLESMVGGLLDFNSVAILYGRRGSAKSFVVVDLTASIASGTRWHGHTVELAPALYVPAEGAAGLGVRYEAWRDANYGTALPAGMLQIYPDPVNLLSNAQVDEFAGMAVELGSRLIVFDTLARCMVGGDENTARDAGMAVEQLDRIRRRTGACVMVVHHSGKAEGAGARGSSAFEAAADTVLEVGMTDDVVTVTTTKQKNHVTPHPTRLRLKAYGPSAVLVDYVNEGTAVSQSMVETLAALSAVEVAGGVSASAWRLSSTVSEATFYRHRKDLLALTLVENVGSQKAPRYQVTSAGTLMLSGDSHAPN